LQKSPAKDQQAAILYSAETERLRAILIVVIKRLMKYEPDATELLCHGDRQARDDGVYISVRTHLSLSKDAPLSRAVQAVGSIDANPILGGLHHHLRQGQVPR
jgi:hypothetical protein